MKMNKFYEFGSEHINSTFQASLEEIPVAESTNRDDHIPEQLQWGNYENVNFPIILKHDRGRILRDVLGTGWSFLYLISDRMKKVLEEHNLTGWKTFPIKLFGKKKEEIHGYHGFSVTGRSGCIDYSNAIMFEKEEIPGSGFCKYYKGMTVDLTKWDNTDFFRPENIRGIIISERAAHALKEAHITNVKLTKLTDVEIDESNYNWWMSKFKAQKDSTNSTK